MKRIGRTVTVACSMFIGFLLAGGILEASGPRSHNNPVKTSREKAMRKAAKRKASRWIAIPAIGRECYLQSNYGGGPNIQMQILGDGSYSFTTSYTGGCIGTGSGCHINVYMILSKMTMVGGIEEWNEIGATPCIDLTMLCESTAQTVYTPPWPVQIGQSIPPATYEVTGWVNTGQCPNVGDSLGGAVQKFFR